MNAQEFLEKEYYWDKTMNDDMGHTDYIAKKMEAYHQAKMQEDKNPCEHAVTEHKNLRCNCCAECGEILDVLD